MSEGKEMKNDANESNNEALENQDSNAGTSTNENESSQSDSDSSHNNSINKSDNVDIGALEATNKSLSGQISALQKQLNEQQKTTKSIENREKVKDLLLNTDLPETVKNTLKEEISELTPDNFEARANRYSNLYNQALESKKQDQASINRPDKSEDESMIQHIENAESEEDILKVFGKLD